MPQSLCVLDGYTFALNAPEQKNPAPKSVQHVTTLGGGYDTVWGVFPQDRVITLTWPVLNAPMYAALEAKKNLLGSLSFTDWMGTAYTVLVLDLTHQSIIKAGTDAYVSVVMTLRVVSSP